MKKKVLCIILMVCLLATSVSFPVTASETNEKAEIIEMLQMIEPQKEEFGFEDIEFTLLEIGQAISVYDYINGQFVFSRNAYPLFYDDGLVAIVYEISDTTYQIMNQISEAVKDLEVEELAFAYDRQGCHVYDGNEFMLILEDENEDLSKDIILENSDSNIFTTDLSVHTILGYTSQIQSRIQTTYMCGVSYVTQLPYNQICWAATTACITNYLKGTSYTAVEIAQDYWETTTNFNQGLQPQFTLEVLNEYLDGVAYYTGTEYGMDNCILSNMMERYPMLGKFYSISNGHAVTIYGYSLSGIGTIWIMDPMSGSVMIEKDQTTLKYSYIMEGSNNIFTLNRVYGEIME